MRTFKEFSTLELSVLFQHLRLGSQHLKKYLNEQQLNDLLSFGELNTHQDTHLPTSPIEKSGSFLLALNTIFTCAVGTWLGVAGFMGFGIGSRTLLIITMVIAAIISSYLGYFNYKATKQTAKRFVTEQKLKNFQLKLIQTLNHKRKLQTNAIANYLNKTLREASPDAATHSRVRFESKEEIVHWLNSFNQIFEHKAKLLTNETIYNIYLTDLEAYKHSLKHWLAKNMMFMDKEQEQLSKPKSFSKPIVHTKLSTKQKHEANFIEILTDPTISIPKSAPQKKSWLATNLLAMFVGFLPTVLGGFGSLFVYFDGIPKIIKELGFGDLIFFTHHPLVKPIEISLAILITAYFGYTFLLNNYRTFQRQQELEHTEKKIINEESHTIEINAKLNGLRKIKQRITLVVSSFQKLYTISTSISTSLAKTSIR